MEKLQPGEEYLRIEVLGQIKLAAFPNKNKTNPEQPDFKGDGVSVWINQKKEGPQPRMNDTRPRRGTFPASSSYPEPSGASRRFGP